MGSVKPFLFAKLKADFSCLGGQAFLIVVIGDEGAGFGTGKITKPLRFTHFSPRLFWVKSDSSSYTQPFRGIEGPPGPTHRGHQCRFPHGPRQIPRNFQ
jgi:hypothetical protein